MPLFTVTIAHPDGSEQTRVISGDSAEHVAELGALVGLEVLRVESTDPTEPAPEPEPSPEPADTPAPAPATEPTGRMYGKSAKGPRRNAAEMAMDAEIEELAQGLDMDPSASTLPAEELLNMLREDVLK